MLEEPIPISAIEHFAYCARQCGLILVDGLWEENEHTVRGARGHRRADEGADREERGRRVLRAVPLWSERYGLTGRADTVELYSDGAVVPVEYKIGSRHGLAADLQLCAQAFCLEEMLGCAVPTGFVWYRAPRKRVRVVFDDRLREETEAAIYAVHEQVRSGKLPPAVDDERCMQCQLIDQCLPELQAHPSRVREYWQGLFRCDS